MNLKPHAPAPGPPAAPPTRLLRVLLLLGALDGLVAAAWSLARPDDLFTLLRLPPPADAFLWQVLAALALGPALCLVLAAARPAAYGGLVLVPLLSRVLQAGLWLWLLGADRVAVPARPLLLLLAHEVVWLPLFVVFLYARQRTEGQAPGPACRIGGTGHSSRPGS
jgi:hypothetical protein